MENIDYGALFGIDEGVQEQGIADPAEVETDTAQGAEEQDVTDPAVEENLQSTGNEDGEKSSDTSNADTDTDDKDVTAQSKEERSRFAAARRKAEAERDAAIEQAKREAKEEADRYIDEAFANSGLIDPYTKKPIASKAEYDEYRKRYDEERKAQVLKKSGMSDEEFSKFVSELPEVKAARQAQEAAQTAARQAQEQQAQARIDEQLKEISALDPSITKLEDLQGMKNYSQFYELVKRGNTLVDAFKLANYDTLTRNTAAAARQAATNAARGKEHLTQTATRGAGAVSVPNDVRETYRTFNPDATDAEIQQHYNKYVKK